MYPLVNFFYNFHVARKKFPHDSLWPLLQCLRKDSVIGISNSPGSIIIQCEITQQQRNGCEKKKCSGNRKHYLVVTSHASSHPSPSSSISSRINSGIARVGWVSFNWTATLLGNSDHSQPFPFFLSLNLQIMSCIKLNISQMQMKLWKQSNSMNPGLRKTKWFKV